MVITETSVFTRRLLELLSDEEHRKLQTALVNRPDSGALIVGSGGLRKVRWALKDRGISMRAELFDELLASVREGGAILRGEIAPSRAFAVDGPNIKRIRATYQLSQSQFAALLGISIGTLRNWEQGRREPEGPARVLLQVAAKHPEAVWDVVRPLARSARAARQSRGKVKARNRVT